MTRINRETETDAGLAKEKRDARDRRCASEGSGREDVFGGSIDGIEKLTGYCFSDRRLAAEALTHSSYSYEHGGKKVTPCNERLEFLGDSVLSVIVSEYLYSEFPDFPEGYLTRCRADLVCEDALSDFAEEIRLGDYLKLGRGEDKNGGRHRKSLLCDAYEALIAAVYLDAGGGEPGKAAVTSYIREPLIRRLKSLLDEPEARFIDYKTLLQETVQSDSKGEKLEYVTVGEEGPDHAKVFTVEARIDSNVFGRGTGSSKRRAEQEAAREALVRCGVLTGVPGSGENVRGQGTAQDTEKVTE
ncbi:MAG: ribonuclease III [Clostridia bacterium]|nr:ribonuclease III [Clostridia bacterium]